MVRANNILLVVAMASVLLGTLYPLALDALNAGKISVGPPYFETVFAPLMAPLVFLMGIGPLASWRRAELPSLWMRLRWALAVAIACALLLPFLLGRWSPLVAAGLFLALWVVAATVAMVVQRLRGAPQARLVDKLRANPSSWYGMLVAHLGIAVFIVGVTLVKGYEVERDVRIYARPKRGGRRVHVHVQGRRREAGAQLPGAGRAPSRSIAAARSPRCCIRRSASTGRAARR